MGDFEQIYSETAQADGLRAAGASVDSVAFYVNRRPEIDREALLAELREDRIDVLTFTLWGQQCSGC